MSANTGLETYLRDHFAGATAGTELADKLSTDYRDGPLGAFLTDLAREIQRDKEELEGLMDALGVRPDPLKQAGAWVAEKVSRFKLGESPHGDADLKRLLNFEVLALGIEGKAEMWRALRSIADSEPAIAKLDLEDLIRRAEAQRSKLETHRLEAARVALAS